MRAPFFLPIPALSTSVRTRRTAFAGCVFLIAWGVTAVAASTKQAMVSRIVDGDTLAPVLQGHPEKVRLIGVDTSELHASASSTGMRTGLWSDNLGPSVPAVQRSAVPPGAIHGNRRSKVSHLPHARVMTCPAPRILSSLPVQTKPSMQATAKRGTVRSWSSCTTFAPPPLHLYHYNCSADKELAGEWDTSFILPRGCLERGKFVSSVDDSESLPNRFE